ncbi:PREDICTED: 39S ribosomal protein L42, mitochondrial [Dufourea novaeangliae]|uniref:Large ribosomal subunit protein mL42 n=1 Tax=Dufourea novaeangliae TaxID=178035 RepID=A0A154PD69_DUFNO|nr:PREDICTED: 39S ribosomal protein L42, mitochondrial [Dufourea novaeangliae]KZC09344.1 39S ribosomal protein L42, mitochondrial [Dufourea novaeangliae]
MSRVLYIARTLNVSCKRYSSSMKLPHNLVVPLNKEMIVCWHPEQEFPYEHSLPLPEEKEISSKSVLCIGKKEIADVFYRNKKRQAVIDELAKMTYTTKHRWYPKKSRFRKREIFIEPERPYL